MKKILILFFLLSCAACNAGDVINDIAGIPGRETLDKSVIGVNNFFLDRDKFGTVGAEFSEIKNTLGLRYVRVLAAWTEGTQPTPSSTASFDYTDEIVASAPSGVDILLVLAHTPAWMADSNNWIDGNPRKTFVENWVKPAARRYSRWGNVIGYQIFNEPSAISVQSDAALGLQTPGNYFELLQLSAAAIRTINASKKVVGAATESIQQNFPHNLDYNKSLRDLGAQDYLDVWAVHIYGKQFEKFAAVFEFMDSLHVPVWITESGEQGPNEQLAYAEQMWPFLTKREAKIERIYQYEFASTAPLEQNFGLKTDDPSAPVSDLYIWLRDN